MQKLILRFPSSVLAAAGYHDLDAYFDYVEKVEVLQRGKDETLHLMRARLNSTVKDIDELIGHFGILEVYSISRYHDEYILFCRMKTNRMRQEVLDALDFELYFSTPEYFDGESYTTSFYIEDEGTKFLMETLQDFKIEHELVAIKKPHQFQSNAQGRLSPMQRKTLLTANAMDYYEFPRGTTLQAIADQLDISRQTAHKHLCKAENKIVKEILG